MINTIVLSLAAISTISLVIVSIKFLVYSKNKTKKIESLIKSIELLQTNNEDLMILVNRLKILSNQSFRANNILSEESTTLVAAYRPGQEVEVVAAVCDPSNIRKYIEMDDLTASVAIVKTSSIRDWTNVLKATNDEFVELLSNDLLRLSTNYSNIVETLKD